MSVTVSNSDLSSLSHIVRWSFGNHSEQKSVSAGGTSSSFTIPLAWIDAIPNAVSGNGTVSVTTFSGGETIGTRSYSFTLTVPSSVIPSVASLTAARNDNNVVPSSWNAYIQNRSGVTLTANGASGSYGSTISTYKFSGDATSSQVGNTLAIGTIEKSGT